MSFCHTVSCRFDSTFLFYSGVLTYIELLQTVNRTFKFKASHRSRLPFFVMCYFQNETPNAPLKVITNSLHKHEQE